MEQTHLSSTSKKTLYILFAVILSITAIYQIRPFVTDEQFAWISVPSYSIIPGLLSLSAAVLAIKLYRVKHYQAKAYLLFAIGAACWFIAEQIWAVYDHVFNEDPFPSEADWFYLAAYPFYFAFLLYSLQPIWKTVSKRILSFSIILSAVLLVPALTYTISDMHGEPNLDVIIAVAYPILSSILLVPAIIGIFFLFKKRANYPWMLLLFGFVTYSIADTFFLFTIIEESYFDGHPVDLVYLYALIFLMFSTLERIRTFGRDKDLPDTLFYSEKIQFETINQFGVPLVAVIIAISVIITSANSFYHTEGNFSPLFVLLGIMAILGAFTGMIFLMNSNLRKMVGMRTRELEEQKNSLENLVEEKTQELLKSERLSAIGELSGRLAHDLRNPLSVMKMSVDMIKQTPADTKISNGDVSKRIDLIEKSIDRISHQVDDVLGFVRNSPLKLSYASLKSVIIKSIEKIKVPYDVKITVNEKDVKANCDLEKLDAVFINLFVNAIQAMPNGGEIKVELDYDGNDAVIKISNSGPPIPNDDLAKIFDPLFTTKQKGTGLGLSSCKNIVEQHNGSISVTNNPVTFTIRLPDAKSTKKPEALPQ